jgi:phenylpyruvate tautomerase
MPFVSIQTNIQLTNDQQQRLLPKISQAIAEETKKPESYVMVSMQPQAAIMFAKETAPAAFVDVKGIQLHPVQNKSITKSICNALNEQTGIAPNRVYILFTSVSGEMWGWNNSTFA